MADKKPMAAGWGNLNNVSEDKTCGLNDMNCLGDEDSTNCGLNDMNCLSGEEDKNCSLNDMNCVGKE